MCIHAAIFIVGHNISESPIAIGCCITLKVNRHSQNFLQAYRNGNSLIGHRELITRNLFAVHTPSSLIALITCGRSIGKGYFCAKCHRVRGAHGVCAILVCCRQRNSISIDSPLSIEGCVGRNSESVACNIACSCSGSNSIPSIKGVVLFCEVTRIAKYGNYIVGSRVSLVVNRNYTRSGSVAVVSYGVGSRSVTATRSAVGYYN